MAVKIYFEPRDVWVGVYWNVVKQDFLSFPGSRARAKEFSVYVCLIPFFPIRFRWLRGYTVAEDGSWVRIEPSGTGW